MTSFPTIILTPRLDTDNLNELNAHLMSLEDKFDNKILASKGYLKEEIYELKNEIELFHDENKKVKPHAWENGEINLLNFEIWVLGKRE